jgi:4-oxalocrotonate tautomerase family enzyme
MPIVAMQIMTGYSAAQKTALLKTSSQAIVDSIAAPLASVRITLQEIEPAHVIVAGEIGHPMARADVKLITGRTEALKDALFAALNGAICESLGIAGDDVRIIVTDVPKTDMGVANGISAKAAGR